MRDQEVLESVVWPLQLVNFAVALEEQVQARAVEVETDLAE